MPRHKLAVSLSCDVCGGTDESLTTDCPGRPIAADRLQEIRETSLDYTDDRGWHLSTMSRTPRFESATAPQSPRAHVDHLKDELALKAKAWVFAERDAEDKSALCTRLEDEVDEHAHKHASPRSTTELLEKLESARIDFRLANQRAERCDDEFHQAARRLVAELEPPVDLSKLQGDKSWI